MEVVRNRELGCFYVPGPPDSSRLHVSGRALQATNPPLAAGVSLVIRAKSFEGDAGEDPEAGSLAGFDVPLVA